MVWSRPGSRCMSALKGVQSDLSSKLIRCFSSTNVGRHQEPTHIRAGVVTVFCESIRQGNAHLQSVLCGQGAATFFFRWMQIKQPHSCQRLVLFPGDDTLSRYLPCLGNIIEGERLRQDQVFSGLRGKALIRCDGVCLICVSCPHQATPPYMACEVTTSCST